MNNDNMGHTESIEQISALRQRIRELEQSEAECRQAEALLKASEENFRRSLDESPLGVRIVTETGETLYANQATLDIFGYDSIETWRTTSALTRYTEQSYREFQARRESRRLGKDDHSQYEIDIVRKEGEVRRIQVWRKQIIWDGKEQFQVIYRDITELKQAEEKNRKFEERLRGVAKMEAIGTLAGGIAHDFNNLLMGIQGYASLALREMEPSHPHYEGLLRIEEQVQSGADLTKQLLGFARGGRYEIKPTDMNDLLEKSSSMFGRTRKEITIHRKLEKELPPAEVDRGQMEQVFLNLFLNASQAMPGGGEIYLETEDVVFNEEQAISCAVGPGRYVKISVADTGTGMDEKTRERIFEPFFTTKEMGRGTGLGLATVYGIIKGHKGAINVYSVPGHGTTFSIYLPASKMETSREKRESGAIAMGTETVLLVDDERLVLKVSNAMLESLGYRVYQAGSGQEALAVYLEKQKEIQIVILDMILPGISGGETFCRLREINPDVRILLSSGHSINGEAKHILDRGCNGFIQKPFSLEKLSRKVREILD